MVVNLRQTISGSVLPLLLFIIGVALLVDPVLGFSRLLPDGVFSLIIGVVLLTGGVFLYWSEIDSNS